MAADAVYPMKIGPCPECKSKQVEDRVHTVPLPYGVAPAQVILSVTETVIHCLDCKSAWTDWRGERARAIVIQRFIGAGPDIAAALVRALKLIDALMPGIKNIAVQNYGEVNDVPLDAHKALMKAGVVQ
jgi:hypothetical protein